VATAPAENITITAEGPGRRTLSLFYLWTFVLACRPQDLLPFLERFHPALLLALATFPCVFAQGSKVRSSFSNKQLKLYAVFIVILALGVPFSYYPWSSLLALFTRYINAVLFVFCFYALVDSVPRLKATLLSLCIGMTFYGLFSLASGTLIDGRLSFGPVFDPNDLSFVIVSLLPFNFLFMGRQNFWLTRLFCLTNLVIGPIIVLMTGSRGGFIAFAIVALMLVFMKNHTLKPGYRALLAVFLIAVAVPVGSVVDLSRFSTILNVQEDYNYTGDEGRWEIWKTGLRLMVQNPVAGVGMECFSQAIGQDREQRGEKPKWQEAHNSWVQVGTETGLAGFLLFGLLNLNAYRNFNRVRRKGRGDLQRIGELALIGFAGHFASAMFLSQAYSFYWAFYIGFSAVLIRLLWSGENEQTA
jgi:O-antigen ligase